MRSEVIHAFINAACDVLRQETGGSVESGQPKLQGGPYRTRDVTVVIGLAQRIEGAIILGLDTATALGYIAYIMGGPVDELDELAQSGVAELANVIAGRAGALLGELGYQSVIAPPTLILGCGSTLSTLSVPRLAVPVHTPVGIFDLQLAARERS